MAIAKSRNMTEGGIARHLILYSIPILLSNLFQTFYTMVDSLVIGWTGNAEAFAAIGAVTPVTDVLIGIVWGFVTGTEILLAQTFGKGDRGEVGKVATAGVVGTLGLGLIAAALGLVLHGPLLHILLGESGDPTIFAHARTYLVIYFLGMPAMALYNIGCSLLRSIGDSQRPLYFLVASSVLNILLDVLFVFVIPLGVAGVALATVLSQTASAIPLFVILFRTDTPVRLAFRRMVPKWRLLCRIFLLGLPGAIQTSISSFANVFTQSYIAGANGSQTANLGGYSAYSKTYSLLLQPVSAIAAGVTIFAAQNTGAGRIDRARRGVRTAMLLGLVASAPLAMLTMLFSSSIPYFFIADPAIVAIASRLLLFMTPCIVLTVLESPLRSAMRGAGDTFTPMVVSLATAVGLRQLVLFLTKQFISNDLLHLSLSHPITWGVTFLVLLPLYLRTFRKLANRAATDTDIKEPQET